MTKKIQVQKKNGDRIRTKKLSCEVPISIHKLIKKNKAAKEVLLNNDCNEMLGMPKKLPIIIAKTPALKLIEKNEEKFFVSVLSACCDRNGKKIFSPEMCTIYDGLPLEIKQKILKDAYEGVSLIINLSYWDKLEKIKIACKVLMLPIAFCGKRQLSGANDTAILIYYPGRVVFCDPFYRITLNKKSTLEKFYLKATYFPIRDREKLYVTHSKLYSISLWHKKLNTDGHFMFDGCNDAVFYSKEGFVCFCQKLFEKTPLLGPSNKYFKRIEKVYDLLRKQSRDTAIRSYFTQEDISFPDFDSLNAGNLCLVYKKLLFLFESVNNFNKKNRYKIKKSLYSLWLYNLSQSNNFNDVTNNILKNYAKKGGGLNPIWLFNWEFLLYNFFVKGKCVMRALARSYRKLDRAGLFYH